jgi:hypothetical protein
MAQASVSLVLDVAFDDVACGGMGLEAAAVGRLVEQIWPNLPALQAYPALAVDACSPTSAAPRASTWPARVVVAPAFAPAGIDDMLAVIALKRAIALTEAILEAIELVTTHNGWITIREP